jgi:hypothetical protein
VTSNEKKKAIIAVTKKYPERYIKITAFIFSSLIFLINSR